MRASGAFVVLLLHGANGTNPKHSPPPVDEESIAEWWLDKYGLANYITNLRYCLRQTGRHTECTSYCLRYNCVNVDARACLSKYGLANYITKPTAGYLTKPEKSSKSYDQTVSGNLADLHDHLLRWRLYVGKDDDLTKPASFMDSTTRHV